MYSAELAFGVIKPQIDGLYDEVESALKTFCSDRNFMLVGRKKSQDSFREKVESGRYPSMQTMDDLVAFSIIVDIRSQQREVLSFLKEIFHVKAEKGKTTLTDERQFDFDCARIYCRLRDKGRKKNGIASWLFEVQIRTILQHAWSKITHSRVYKVDRFDARKARLAAEMMAHIETADRIFATFQTSARSVKSVSRREMEFNQKVITRIDSLVVEGHIPKILRPQNGRRLAENVTKSIKNVSTNIDRAIDVIADFIINMQGKFPHSASLYQIIIVALHDGNLLEQKEGRGKRFYPIDESLVALFPSVDKIRNRFSVNVE